MKSMKLTEEEMKEKVSPQPALEREQYPYGLCIHLDDEMYKRLEVGDTPKVGDEFMILAKATVKEVRKEMNNQADDTSMTLQITDMDMKKEKEKKDTATELYGG